MEKEKIFSAETFGSFYLLINFPGFKDSELVSEKSANV